MFEKPVVLAQRVLSEGIKNAGLRASVWPWRMHYARFDLKAFPKLRLLPIARFYGRKIGIELTLTCRPRDPEESEEISPERRRPATGGSNQSAAFADEPLQRHEGHEQNQQARDIVVAGFVEVGPGVPESDGVGPFEFVFGNGKPS